MSAVPTVPDLFADHGSLASAIVAATDDCVFAKDLHGRYQFANPATLRAMGCSLADVLGHTDAQCVPDAAAARRLMEIDQRVLHSGEAVEIEEAVPLPDGRVQHWLTRKMPLRDATGCIVGLLGIAREASARDQADAQRDATRLKLEMAIQAAGLVTAEIDYRRDVNHISGELARLLELGPGPMTVPRQAIFDRIHPEDRDRYLQAIRCTIDPASDGHLAIDVRALLPSGTVRWLHIRLQVTFIEVDGQRVPDRGICAARDVTVEMIAERKMHAAQRLTESVIEGAGALVYAKDLEGRFILSNQAWRTLHGLTPEQARAATDIELFGAETAARLRENDRLVVETGQPVLVQERAVLGGRPVTFRSSKFPLYDDWGQIYAVCGVSTDITDVVDADRRKDEFIAMLAHELRNPLAPIRYGLELLRRGAELSPPAARTRDMMERQLNHMVRLVDDLLDVSRISRGKLELKLESIFLADVVQHALEATHPAVEAAGHQLRVELPGSPVALRGDLTRLAQVFSNLLHNACKYTPQGGKLLLSARVEGGQVAVEVCDNGRGIDTAMLPNVFDLFVQVEGNRADSQGGLGIGLWLVKRLVELHQGSIEARSEGAGRGCVFTVRLPVRDAGDRGSSPD
jgi:PAS domain S-box-containing protein